MRVLLFGASGQVGHALLGLHPDGITWVPVTRQDCDLTDATAVRRFVKSIGPDAIVNAAAYTAVDRAESDREICIAVNALAPAAMAQAAETLRIPMIQYSTDYVFDGSKTAPYVEDDATGPRNVYGASKLDGEQRILATGASALVLRTSWVYSNHGANFLKTMLRLGAERPELRIVADQQGAPTSAPAIAAATVRLLESEAALLPAKRGVYHMTAAGATTWHGFAAAIFRRAGGPTPRLTPIATADYPTPAARPANSVLDNSRFAAAFGFRLPEWESQLEAVLAARLAPAAVAD